MKRRHYVRITAAAATIRLLILDVLLYHAGIIAAFWIRFLGRPPAFNFWSYRDLINSGFLRITANFGIPIPGYLWLMPPAIFYLSGMYRLRWSRARVEDFMIVLRCILLTTILLLAGMYVYRSETVSFPTSVLFLSFFTSSALTISWRLTIREIYQHRNRKKRSLRLCIIGGGATDHVTVERFLQSENPRYDVVACLASSTSNRQRLAVNAPHVGGISELQDLVRDRKVDEVLIVPTNLSPADSLELVRTCESERVPYRYIPTFMEVLVSGARVDLVNFVPTVQFGKSNIEGWNVLFKRSFDVVISFAALVLLSWLFLFASAWIMLDSPGPPFFVQIRVGRYGRRFKMFKFRTMHHGAENGSPLTRPEDPRITRAGKFLRRTSIDELPQLINVLTGDMSLVGPRAVVPFVADKFNELEEITLNVSPGMTGLAQVSGRDELSFKDKSVLNIYYIRNYSLLLDLRILLRTIVAVLKRVGTNGTRME